MNELLIEEIIRRAEEKGIDVVDVILRELNKVDPNETMRLRLQLAEKYMQEAEDYVKRGDVVQASEKAYKVAGELAEKYNIPEYQEAIKEERWFAYLLQKAANRLSRSLGDWVLSGWSIAYALHLWGFHEGRLKVDDVDAVIRVIEEMLGKARQILARE